MCDVKNAVWLNSFIDELYFYYGHITVTYVLSSEFLMPGLIDTHIHAPQYPNAGKGLDHGLLDWLNKYTFPTEAKFQELEFAKNAYRKIVVST